MALLVVGLVVIVLVILVVVFLSVRSSRNEDEDYPVRPAGRGPRDTDPEDASRRAGQSRPLDARPPVRGRPAREPWEDDRRPGYSERPGYRGMGPGSDDYAADDDYKAADAYRDPRADRERGTDRELRDHPPGQGRRNQIGRAHV